MIGRLVSNNHRFIANTGDEKTRMQLARRDREPIGRRGWVWRESGKGEVLKEGNSERARNLFFFDEGMDGKVAKL